MTRPLRVATRGSRLACWQAERVVARLDAPAELVIVTTTGDRRADVPIDQLGSGVFVKEVEEAVREGRADLAVHSAKDLPSLLAPGLVLAAVPERADPRDALVGVPLDALPTGGRVGTGSVRRRAQLAALRPDLTFGPLRGNLETRVAKAVGFDAVVVAYAALLRLGLEAHAAEILDTSVMLPQVAQGALAVECREDDDETRRRLASIDDARARAEVEAERAYLAELGGGCSLPVGALAASRDDGTRSVTLTALLATADGRIVLRVDETGDEPVALGRRAACRLLDECGGRSLLEGAA